jgi:hypothetical protein
LKRADAAMWLVIFALIAIIALAVLSAVSR